MINFKLCNNGQSVVGTREDGVIVSYTIEAPEYKQWLLDGGMPEPEFTALEISKDTAIQKVQIALSFLSSTDWVEAYLIKHYLGIELLDQASSKFALEQQRKDAKLLILQG